MCWATLAPELSTAGGAEYVLELMPDATATRPLLAELTGLIVDHQTMGIKSCVSVGRVFPGGDYGRIAPTPPRRLCTTATRLTGRPPIPYWVY